MINSCSQGLEAGDTKNMLEEESENRVLTRTRKHSHWQAKKGKRSQDGTEVGLGTDGAPIRN